MRHYRKHYMILHFHLSSLGLEEGSGPAHMHGQHPLFPSQDRDRKRPCRATLMGQMRTELQMQQGHGDGEAIFVPSQTSQSGEDEKTRESSCVFAAILGGTVCFPPRACFGVCLLGFAILPVFPRMLHSPLEFLGVFPRAVLGWPCSRAGLVEAGTPRLKTFVEH